jgi:RNA polymerase sigma factor (sigma-70 family)
MTTRTLAFEAPGTVDFDGAHASAPPAADAQQAALAALVARMARGDEAALEALYDAASARVHGFVLRICGSPTLAEEVVGDAFYQAWTDAARYDATRAKPLSWLLMLARSRAIDALRARDKAVLHEAPETLIDADEDARARGLDELLAQAQSNAALGAVLGELSATQRQMIALAFYRGLSHGEIAAHTGLPLGTVKAHIRRALAILRDALGDDPEKQTTP